MENDSDEIPLTFSDIGPLVSKTYLSFTIPLIMISLLFSSCRLIIASLNQDMIQSSQVFVSIIVMNSQFHVFANGLDYSKKFKGKTKATIYTMNDECSINDTHQYNISHSQFSIALVPMGNCTISQKAYNAKLEGFKSIILYGQISHEDSKSLQEKFQDIYVFSLPPIFYFGLLRQMKNQSVALVDLESNLKDHWNIKNILFQLIFDLLVIFFSQTSVFISWLLLWIIVNFLITQRLTVHKSIVNACLSISLSNSSKFIPKLQTIPFEEKTLTCTHLEELKRFNGIFESDITSYHDSCSICLEEFIVKDKVRCLPCRHLFHSSCIDSWLLNHNRLCPVCQQDVLKPGHAASHEHDDDHDHGYDSEDLMLRGDRQIRGNLFHHRMTRFIQRCFRYS